MSPSVPGPRRAPTRGRRAFAATWWGQAWVTALEDSTLDSGRLSRGRTYARQGMVGPVTIAPGQVKAAVQGSRPRPYRSAVHLPVLTDAQWDTLLDTIAARAGHLAALLDGEMPAELVDDARHAGVPLLPQPTELDPECSCPDWGYPCKHAAALCYAIAATIDADPFAVFALRGRGREEVLGQLRARRTASQATSTPSAPAGLPAAGAYAAWAARAEHTPPLPELPEPAPHTAALPAAPPPGTGLSSADLERLMADTASRATRLLTGDTTSLHLSQREDAVRIAASDCGPEWVHHLVQNTGAKPNAFARLTRAWRHGGPTGITVAEHPHAPDPTAMTAARTALTETLTEMTTAPVSLRTWRNRLTLTDHGIQLRLGPDTRWYPYLQEHDGDWWPAAPADPDPVTSLTSVWQRTEVTRTTDP
ncbi:MULTISPECIES: SWIM zinc finger family protein [unclassified Streptomyces]|uniref:SWIM zinc finger family protein n=1 Tax=unclassified Streptomyces TaxID=2593676 RepID=UPI00224E66C2|nr:MULTISPECIES: SWIM zinc finger family protein [unclassified Streptomyces]WSP53423.1 SWIM zinc finger family protein [Streptomyces sp. NBC_01241]WSU25905.1 SWIM zinc finger family protein [Streptomyces sp. NBC_01108]MCX4784794.1 SWIM zinc finger family protein [Streptomyces sp. NBC_01221]MCX4799248.1 SWIM zinc finger family protein [Streptomyces sp. NBC_01242]WSJ40432.1 SWIM zinc finger family protein [Streptomyces sp. NBC_01321]